MRCLNVVWVVIPPRSAHSFRIPVVGNHIVIVCELFVADGTLVILLDNLAVQELSHLSGGSEFPISSRMMRIINASNPRLQSARIGRLLPAAAGNRFVDWAVLIATKPHCISSWESRRINCWYVAIGVVTNGTESLSDRLLQCLSEGDYDEPDGSNPAIAEGKTARARRNGAAERGVGGPGRSWSSGRKG